MVYLDVVCVRDCVVYYFFILVIIWFPFCPACPRLTIVGSCWLVSTEEVELVEV